MQVVIVTFDIGLHRGGGGRCLQGNLWYIPPASITSRLASVTFKMASKVFIEETDKNFNFITEIPFRFLGFRDFKVPIVIKKTRLLSNFLEWNCWPAGKASIKRTTAFENTTLYSQSTCSHLHFTHRIRPTRDTADRNDTTTELSPINILPFKENY